MYTQDLKQQTSFTRCTLNKHQDPIRDADASVTTGSRALPATQAACLAWLSAAGVAVSGDNRSCLGFDAALAAAEAWMGSRDRLGGLLGGGLHASS